MPNPNLVELVCLIDRSGSMSSIKNDAEGGFNSFLNEQKRNIKGKGVKVTLAQFDTVYEMVWNGMDLNECGYYHLDPRGGTALLDSIGKIINDVGSRLSNTPEYMRPGKVIVMIVTDGEENSSREFTKEKIKSMVEHQRDVYSWDFIFLGTTEGAIKDSVSWGLTKNATYDFNKTRSMYTAMASNVCYAINNDTEVSNVIDDTTTTTS